jgi:ParB-like nuclease domain
MSKSQQRFGDQSNPPPADSDLNILLEAKIEHTPIGRLKPYKNNARTHSKKQIRQIANSIKRFGFTNPVLIDDAGEIIAGHGRVEAAKLLGLTAVPTIRLRRAPSSSSCNGFMSGISPGICSTAVGGGTSTCRPLRI